MHSKRDNREFNRSLGQRLRLVRKQRSLSEIEVAETLRVTPRFLRKLESGRTAIAAVDLFLLAKKFDMPVEFFIHEEPLLDWSAEWQVVHAFRQLGTRQQERTVQFLLDLAGDVPVTDRDRSAR